MRAIYTCCQTKSILVSCDIDKRSRVGVDSNQMKSLPISRILRLALAISVSLWMAGAGCLLGCSNETRAASSASDESVDTVVAEGSCASSHSHDCCAKKKAHHASAPKNNPQIDPTEPLLQAAESRMIESCPMAVNASAIVSKSRAEISKASVAKTIEAPPPSTVITTASRSVDRPSVPNRGPTYLRCCVFLI